MILYLFPKKCLKPISWCLVVIFLADSMQTCGKMLVSFRLDSYVPKETRKIKSPDPSHIRCLGEIAARIIDFFVYGKLTVEMETLFWELEEKGCRVCRATK